MPTRSILSACAILTAALAVACGGDDPQPNYPTGQGGAYASGGYGAGRWARSIRRWRAMVMAISDGVACIPSHSP